MAPRLTVSIESWPIAGSFTISRGTKTEAVVVVTRIEDGDAVGRGECVPYARYGETPGAVYDAIVGVGHAIEPRHRRVTSSPISCRPVRRATRSTARCGTSRPSAAASRPGRLAGLGTPQPVVTAYTLSLGTPEAMARGRPRGPKSPAPQAQARRRRRRGAAGGACARTLRQSGLIVDANEGWPPNDLAEAARCLRGSRRRSRGAAAARRSRRGAGRHRRGRSRLRRRERPRPGEPRRHWRVSYDAINIKLDKTGGLTEALALSQAARERRPAASWSAACSRHRWPWRRRILVAQNAEWRRSRRAAAACPRPRAGA